jgi:hypothetical protein
MVTQALGMSIGQASKAAKRHANGQVETLDMASAYLIFVRLTEDW